MNKISVINYKNILLFVFCLCFTISKLKSQNQTSSQLYQGIKKLNVTASVLYIAAHPDDENTRLLSWLSKEKNVRTAYLSLTRGDGGQNLIGKEQGEMLGLLRTQELLAARKIDGAEQFFTRANDFGYSKNPNETFNFWNKDSILSDVVWVIRNFQPDIIICRFPTTGEGGHGHHTASAILAEEAFEAAADPDKFTWQLKYTSTWKTKRLFWNTYNFGNNNTTSEDQLKVDVGGYNVFYGKSYGEIAAESRTCHKSQGFGSAKNRGSTLEYFKQLKGDVVKNDLFENINLNWSRFTNTETIQKKIEECIQKFNIEKPEASIDHLIEVFNLIKSVRDEDKNLSLWKAHKGKEVMQLIQACAGLWVEAFASDPIAIPGNTIEYTLQVLMRNPSKIKINKINWISKEDSLVSKEMMSNQLYTFKHRESVSDKQIYSNPYWLEYPHETGSYYVKEKKNIGKPENDIPLSVQAELEINNSVFRIETPLVYKSTDPVKGEIYRPLEILPPATLNFSENVYIFPDNHSKKIHIKIKSNTNNLSGSLLLEIPEGWNVSKKETPFSLNKKGDEANIEISVNPGENSVKGKLKASLLMEGKTFNKSISRIEYDHIPHQFALLNSEAIIEKIDLKKGGTKIGYIMGAGDDVPACLQQAGYEIHFITEENIEKMNLHELDAIVTGVRAYNTSDWISVHYNLLMSYIQSGGNLIVQYNTNNRIGPLNAKPGPYPFTISRERVTDENAEVKILNPSHPAVQFPNKITENDFKDWVQERGIYFATEADSSFAKIFSMNDSGEKSSDGSLIIAPYGKGNFVYTGIAFFRQLKAGVPGSYRLFSNLLALPENN